MIAWRTASGSAAASRRRAAAESRGPPQLRSKAARSPTATVLWLSMLMYWST
jgi:hypothetical protein